MLLEGAFARVNISFVINTVSGLRFPSGSEFGKIIGSSVVIGRPCPVLGRRRSLRLQSAVRLVQKSMCRPNANVEGSVNATSAIRCRSTNFNGTASDSEMLSSSKGISPFNCSWMSSIGVVSSYSSWMRFNNARSSAQMVLFMLRAKSWYCLWICSPSASFMTPNFATIIVRS